jgi:uncharacterized SAM-binding protein YcdF (DUF218 family)
MEAGVRKIMLVTGIVFLIYGLAVLALIRFGNIFNFFYLCAGIFLIVFSFLMKRMDPGLTKILVSVLVVLAVFFTAVEIRIVSYGIKEAEKDADYLIVLGSQMKEDGPSMDYRARLESAYEYLVKNPEAKVITTGARGDFEPVSEAKGGADYLIKKGISSDRIIMENKSYDTLQNLSNAYDLIVKDGKDPKEIKTVIVSALYHLYRASYIAEKIGYRNISCKGGHGLLILLPHYYTREFFALIKEWIVL